MSVLKFFAVVALMLVQVGCTKTQWVASIGNERISQTQAATRAEMMSFFDPKMNEKKALDQLISFKKTQLALKAKGVSITDEMLKSRLQSKKNQAKNNPALADFMKKFEGHSDLFSLYLMPEEASSRLGQLCQEDNVYHKAEFDKAQAVLEAAQKNPADFEKVAQSLSVPFLKGSFENKKWVLNWEKGRELASTNKSLEANWFSQKIKRDVLDKTEPEKMYSAIYPIHFGFLVFKKNNSEQKGMNHFSMAMVPRKSCSDWNKAAFASLPPVIRVNDKKK